jgi:hypothetical protein
LPVRPSGFLQRKPDDRCRAGRACSGKRNRIRPFVIDIGQSAVEIIVIGSHGRTGLDCLLAGSVAERGIG